MWTGGKCKWERAIEGRRNVLRLNTERQVSWLSNDECREKEGEGSRTKEKMGESAKLPNSDVQFPSPKPLLLTVL